MPAVKNIFGVAKASDTSASNARAGVNEFYDCLNKLMILTKIDKYHTSEKEFLTDYIDELKEILEDKKLLLIFDRGYICTNIKAKGSKIHF